MTRFLKCLLLVASICTILTSCEKDELTPTISLSQRSIILSELGESATVTYSGANIDNISSSSAPDGWSVNISGGVIYVSAPTEQKDFERSYNTTDVKITVKSKDDRSASTTLTLGTTSNNIDLTPVMANSFIISKAHTVYSLSATTAGASGESIAPQSAKLIWQTANKPVSMVRLNGDKISFYVPNDVDDLNENGAISDVVEGNALIGVLDGNGQVLWSYHLWITNYSPDKEPIILNGATVMNRNLGANNNANDTEEEILASYGMYYQWGRKDPFPAPSTYNAAYGTDAPLYNEFGYSVKIQYEESTPATGSALYATAYPTTYITGVEESSYDWLYADHSQSLWSDSKSINDPCPYGWRVASESTFDDMKLPTLSQESIDELANSYGWELTNGSTSALFMGLGRRGQITGRIQNVNTNEVRPAPWIGYYWSNTATTDNNSSALYFAYDSTNIDDCTIENGKSSYRATGMQIRCQKIE